jgi:hypothetical protein
MVCGDLTAASASTIAARSADVAKSVDAADLKSAILFGYAGSSPAVRTIWADLRS